MPISFRKALRKPPLSSPHMGMGRFLKRYPFVSVPETAASVFSASTMSTLRPRLARSVPRASWGKRVPTMVSWSGETFWAKDAQECAGGITRRAEALAVAIQEFVDEK